MNEIKKANTVKSFHDARNRLTRVIYDDGSEVNYTYNGNLLARVVDAVSDTHFMYDEHGRLVTKVRKENGVTFTITHEYTDLGMSTYFS